MELRSLRYFLAVAEERHVGRAAQRLHMTQPPLSRAIRQLENDLGCVLFERTPRGVDLTPAGAVMLREARAVLDQAERLRRRVAVATGPATLVVGTLADAVEHLGTPLVRAFREAHPNVTIAIHEADLGDPSAGLRADLVDVALTRTPFETSGLALRTLRTEPIGAVLPADDPLAVRDSVTTAELAGRHTVRLPDGTDERWRDHWTLPGARPDPGIPPMRTIQECLQAVLWNGAVALAPLGQPVPASLVAVPVADRSPSELVVAWRRDRTDPLIRSFVGIAAGLRP
ncbi:LysR family transcriptional regulator [Actinoallomurus iriomotensis]|uniref:LysR family transcriptional regulator n=1 Tax=Actinoallomurus iriomotensis TaxID=478107 RepID=A0A9W6W5I6_9ACTN|nr:LysR substrate-binding domain-containing protein [Actinoallomurus iriomotensis]GLY91524.1 LysR family transcriptional regulator [Actinoallomurus iriomotensis]